MAPTGGARAVARRWVETAADIWRLHPRRLPVLMGKLVLARTLLGFNPRAFFMNELDERPFRTWRDHMKDGTDFFAGTRAVNWSPEGLHPADDKVIAAERCIAHGVRHAPLVAVVGRDRLREPTAGTTPSADSVPELVAVLEHAPDRLFVKPARGSSGRGAARVERADGGWRYDGDVLSSRSLAERLLTDRPPGGWLVQRQLVNHREVQLLATGTGLCTVRVVVALTHSGALVLNAILRILGSDAAADNFRRGTTGNLAARVDLSSGRLRRVYLGPPGGGDVIRRTTRHPVSGAPLVGVALPCWSEVLDLARRAATAFPEVPLAGLDIAITEEGPVFLEINTQWSGEFAQMAGAEGVRTTLRRIWPELAAPSAAKDKAARLLGL